MSASKVRYALPTKEIIDILTSEDYLVLSKLVFDWADSYDAKVWSSQSMNLSSRISHRFANCDSLGLGPFAQHHRSNADGRLYKDWTQKMG